MSKQTNSKKYLGVVDFFRLFKTWEEKEAFVEALISFDCWHKNDNEKKDFKLYFMGKNKYNNKMIDEVINKEKENNYFFDESQNAHRLYCMKQLLGEECFENILDTYNGCTVKISAKHQRNLEIYLARKNGKEYYIISQKHNIKIDNARQIYSRVCKIYDI